MKKREKKLWLSTVTVTAREDLYVNDALQKIPGENCYEYIGKFEDAVAKYVGAKYALATSCGTGAIHLSMLVAAFKPGDEVILPDFSYIAAVTPVVHAGGTPVFADVKRDTWCMDPESVRRLITPKTRAIVPVHMFGSVTDMDEIMAIAREHDLLVLEDACPSLGVTYKGAHPAAIGDMGALSFQGAKIITSGGRGGMFITNNEEFYNKAKYYNTLCMESGRDPEQKFFHSGFGFHYPMSQLQAAMGYAQLEQIEEYVTKKRQVFAWYKERLSDISGLQLNVEPDGVRSNYWMVSIVMDGDFPATRREVSERLHDWNVDNRSFFLPMTSFPMFTNSVRDGETPVSREVARAGINLPSGITLTEEDVEYASQCVKKALRKEL